MSIAPHTGIVDFGTFTSPTALVDGIQGEVPRPLAGQGGYVLTATGWTSAGSVGLVGYQGTWNASTNSPTLTSSVGTQGYYYVVSIAGSTNLNGITDWQVGDWAIFNGSVWQKVDNTDSYDPTNVAITGGTINNTSIGGTTPAAGTFTTLTAQTERLNGTGQNLLLQSQDFTSATWTKSNLTAAITSATTDPLGGLTADILTPNGTTDAYCRQTVTPVLSTSYGYSVYAKAGTGSWLRLRALFINNNTTDEAWFNLSTGALGTVQASVTATITSVGNGWYRCALVGSTIATNTASFVDVAVSNADNTRANTNGQTIYVWGSQLELSTIVGTYIATTSAVVYGTPSLSFSGVAGLGLQSDGSLYVSPAGTGALQAQATTSTTTGGNARGANATDWQTSRNTAAQVASGTQTTIGGGINNTASGTVATVAGGTGNAATQAYASILGGISNGAAGYGGVVCGGYTNQASGYFSFIGTGYTNSGTATAAVTTQSGTMNSTTAVTLSASNASIKVGQLITGTSITTFPATYVAAISGTSLTLSQVASGSSTSTLSFFTPHGIVVGGGNNQATGSYSFIGGGGDAGTAANRNAASGDWATIVGGYSNTAAGNQAFVGAGNSNSASAGQATISGGSGNNITGQLASIIGGNLNTASALVSSVLGGQRGTTRAIVGNMVSPACSTPVATGAGFSQGALLVLGRQTTDATATVIASDANAASGTNQVTLPNNSAYYFKGSLIANVTGAANGAAWSFEGAIMRGANAGSTVLIGTPVINRIASSSGATAWSFTLTTDTTNGALAITVTGVASTTIRWVAKVETTEVTF